jgi:RNA recognition motif-containing protein
MGKRLYVGNLPWSTSSSDLQAMFEQFGAVRSAEVIMDRVTGRSRGFGFVEMDNDETMNAAIEALNGKDNNGRPMVVNEARERSPRPNGGGSRGSRGGAGRYSDR